MKRLKFYGKTREETRRRDRRLTLCVCGVCLISVLILLGLLGSRIPAAGPDLDFAGFFREHIRAAVYFLVMDAGTFVMFGVDKRRAVRGDVRIRNFTLLAVSFAGGAAGGLLAMAVFRHKTRKTYYTAGLPMMMAVQILAVLLGMNW